MEKKCTKCNKIKNIFEFHKDISRKDGFSNKCKKCRCKHPEVLLKKCLGCNEEMILEKNKTQKYCSDICRTSNSKYGIDKNIYNKLFESNNGKCHICNNFETSIDKRTNKIYSLSIDHCHKNNNVRGLLCSACNTAIGLLKDNIEILNNAIVYLNKDLNAKNEYKDI